MNKHVLALSTALSILVFTPAFAQNNNAATVDCTQQANKNDPACLNKQNNNSSATQTQTQPQPPASSSTTSSGQAAQTGTSTTKIQDQNAQTGSGATTTTTDQNAQSTTKSSTTQMTTGELIVPADRLNNAQMISANDYIGKKVYDQAGNKIGDVNDLIISQDGQVQAVILGVGGFLGIGEKDVAVNTNAVQIVQDGDNMRLVVQTTKEALNSAPTYDKKNRRYATEAPATTTDTTGSTTAPAPAPANSNAATGNTSNSVVIDCNKPENASNAACVNKTQTQQ